jgi:tetratricopeptide (TPR) repeat protein
LGHVAYRQKIFASAIEHYTAALAIPEYIGEVRAFCHHNLGLAAFKQNNFTGAIEHYTAALAIPELPENKRNSALTDLGYAHLGYGTIRYEESDYLSADRYLEKALEMKGIDGNDILQGKERNDCFTMYGEAHFRVQQTTAKLASPLNMPMP